VRIRDNLIECFVAVSIGLLCAVAGLAGAAKAQAPAGVPWGLPPLPPGVGPV